MIETASAPSPLSVSMTSEMCSRKPREVLELLHRADEFLQVLQPARRRRPSGPSATSRCSRIRRARSRRARCAAACPCCARQRSKAATRSRSAAARLGLQLVGLDERRAPPRISGTRCARAHDRAATCSVASPSPRFGMLTMRSKARSSAGWLTSAQIGERVADLRALVEARAADDAIGQAERDEAVLELAHLERGAHQDGDLVERMAVALQLPRSPRRSARASSSESHAPRDGRPSRPARPRCAASCRAGLRCGRSGARRRRGCGRSSGSCARAGSPWRRGSRARSAGCCRPRRRASRRSTGRRRRRSRCSCEPWPSRRSQRYCATLVSWYSSTSM